MRSNWQTFGGPVRRGMMILLSSIRPIVLTAGKIYNLDIEQFRTVNILIYHKTFHSEN